MCIIANQKNWLLVICLLGFFPGFLFADHVGPVEKDLTNNDLLTVRQLVALVIENNAGISELVAAQEAATFRIEPAGSLEDPIFSYGFAPPTLQSGERLNQKLELSQNIPWPGTLQAREQVAIQMSSAAEKDVDVRRLELVLLAKLAYAEWYFIERSLEIHRSTHELLEELRSVAEVKYAAGRALQQDVLQAEVEQKNLERHGLELHRLKKSVQAKINALLNQHPQSSILPAAPISIYQSIPSLDRLEQMALDNHPELKRLDAYTAVDSAQIILAEKSFYPDIKLSAGYNSLWNARKKRPIVGVSINIPFNQSRRKAALNGAKASMRQRELQLVNRRAELLSDITRAHAEVSESVEAVELFENSLVPLASEYLSAAIADYQSGAGNFLSVIAAEQKKLVTEEGLERNRADYLRRVAELERWTGQQLDEQLVVSQGGQYEAQ